MELDNRIDVEGIIGAGKSCLLNKLNSLFGYEVYTEPLDKFTLLDKFYIDKENYAFPLQQQIIKVLSDLEKNRFNQNYYFSERSSVTAINVFSRMLCVDGYINEQQYKELAKLASKSKLPKIIIHVKCKEETALERIEKRGRECEIGKITIEYLQNLNSFYSNYLSYAISKGTKVLLYNSENPDDFTLYCLKMELENLAPQLKDQQNNKIKQDNEIIKKLIEQKMNNIIIKEEKPEPPAIKIVEKKPRKASKIKILKGE